MRSHSHDREEPNERKEAPAVPEPGASLLGEASDLLSRLRTLVHDQANWYQRLEGQLEALARRHGIEEAELDPLRWGLQRCADLGLRALGAELPANPAVLPALVHDFAARDRRGGQNPPLKVESSASAPTPLAIPALVLENALLNLVKNARESAEEDVELSIRCRGEGAMQIVEVVDTGAGMAPEVLRHCRDWGFSTKAGSGRGLGMASVAAEIEKWGGKMEVESVEGEGTTVRLLLPRASAPRTLSAARRMVDPALPAGVLLVEDDPEVAEVMAAFLETAGVQSQVVRRGEEIWSHLEDPQIQAVILDQGLPDLPGSILAEAIRQRHPDLVLVLLTGDPSAVPAPGARGPLDAVGVKPLGRGGLLSLLQEAVGNAARRNDDGSPRQKPAQA